MRNVVTNIILQWDGGISRDGVKRLDKKERQGKTCEGTIQKEALYKRNEYAWRRKRVRNKSIQSVVICNIALMAKILLFLSKEKIALKLIKKFLLQIKIYISEIKIWYVKLKYKI